MRFNDPEAERRALLAPSAELNRPLPLRLDDEEEEEEEDDDDDKPKKTKPAEAPGGQVESALYKSRTVLIFGPINMRLAQAVSAKLLALDSENDKPIRVLVNSPGGHVESGDTIHDMIRFVAAPVQMIGTGWVASAGAHIYLSVPKERRFCLPNTRFMLHQPSGGVRGPAVDIDIEAREIIKMRERLNQTIADATGQPLERVSKDTDRNFWMSSQEAFEYGVVGQIIGKIGDLPA